MRKMADKLSYRDYLKIASTLVLTLCGIIIIGKNYTNVFALFIGVLFIALGLYRLSFVYRYFKRGRKL